MDECEAVTTAVAVIVAETDRIAHDWSGVEGWAPDAVAEVLGRASLDWQASLARTLSLWVADADNAAPDAQGRLILAWANLGALVEGTLRWFAAVYADDYLADPEVPRAPSSSAPDTPDQVKFERLRVFFAKRVWTERDEYDAWIQVVQQRRNAIHAFRTRPLGTFVEFGEHVRRYADLLCELQRRAPHPPL